MPQMSPMWWTTLMITFIIMIIVINTMTYFNKNYLTKSKSKSFLNKKMNWKW